MALHHIEPKTPAPSSGDELRDLLLVVRRALLLVIAFWEQFSGDRYPTTHPYRQAAAMIVKYIERRYLT